MSAGHDQPTGEHSAGEVSAGGKRFALGQHRLRRSASADLFITSEAKRSAYHARRLDTGRKMRDHIRQLQAFGFTVTLEPAT